MNIKGYPWDLYYRIIIPDMAELSFAWSSRASGSFVRDSEENVQFFHFSCVDSFVRTYENSNCWEGLGLSRGSLMKTYFVAVLLLVVVVADFLGGGGWGVRE